MKKAVVRKSQKNRERGATMVEYGLLVILIAILGMSGLEIVGFKVANMFVEIKERVGQGGGHEIP